MKWRQVYKVDQSVLTTYLEGAGNRDALKELLNLPSVPYKYIGGMIYFREKELKNFENVIIKSPLVLVNKSMDAMIRVSDKFVEVCKTLNKQNNSKKSAELLKQDYIKFCRAWKDLLGLASTPVFVENVIEDMLEKELGRYIDPEKEPEKYEKYLASIINLTKDTFGIKEKKDFYKIADHIFKRKINNFENNAEIKDLIKEHLEKWSWIKVHLLLGEPMSEPDLIERLHHTLENSPSKEFKKIKKEKEKHKKKLDKTLSDLPELKKLADATQLIIYVRDYRYALACQGCFYIRRFLSYIAKQFNLAYEDIIYYLPREVKNLFEKNKKIDPDIINERKKDYALIICHEKEILAIKEECKKIRKEEEEEIEDIKEFSGIVASKGSAKGMAKIVLSHEDLKKIDKGDILIAQQTIPDFVPSMEKASAIITDLGGITSHAAIISRELGIPCIVGTKIATKVLKDNDLVEVNANHGVVKILRGVKD